MLKLVKEPAPNYMTCQTHYFVEMVHLPLSVQFETIQNQARLGAIAEGHQHPVQTLTLVKITSNDITPNIYPSLRDFENQQVVHSE